jgi:hypothetical protein
MHEGTAKSVNGRFAVARDQFNAQVFKCGRQVEPAGCARRRKRNPSDSSTRSCPRARHLRPRRAIAEQLAEKAQLFLRYTTLASRQRLLWRLNEGTELGMALEGLTAAELAYQQQRTAA